MDTSDIVRKPSMKKPYIKSGKKKIYWFSKDELDEYLRVHDYEIINGVCKSRSIRICIWNPPWGPRQGINAGGAVRCGSNVSDF